jgi:hypothetical protein
VWVPWLYDLLGGQVDFAVAALPSFQGHIKAGSIRPIGTLTGGAIGSATGDSDVRRARA